MNILAWIFGMVSVLIPAASSKVLVAKDGGEKQTLSSKVHNFKMDLHRTLEGLRVRKKRQMEASHDASYTYQMRVGSATTEELPYLSDYRLTLWIPVEHEGQRQVLIGTQEGNLMLYQLSAEDDRHGQLVASAYEEEVAVKAQAFSYYDEQWFIILQSARNQTWIRLYLRQGRGLENLQTITLDGEADFDLITLKGVHYMAVTTHHSARNSATLALYHWTQTQFDVIATRTVYGPRSVACWVLDGTLYIVVAQKQDGTSGNSSPVFLYNAKDERGLVLQQMLSIEGPIKVLHFYVNSNHYVIFIGSQNAAIYWWSSNQFLLWQIIPNTANAVDVSVLTLSNGEVVIVVALQEEVLFITLDSSGHYIISFSMPFWGYYISSLQFMYSGEAYYALALFAATTYSQPLQMVRKLTLEPYYVPTGSSLDTLRQCLSDVYVTLEERQSEMNNINVDLGRVWLRNEEQKINSLVFVNGKIASTRKCVVENVKVVRLKKMLPDSSLSEIDHSMSSLKAIAHDLQQNVLKSVRKSIEQKITGTKKFDHVYAPSLVLKSSYSDIPVNGVPVSRMQSFALRKYGNQIFQNPVQVANAYTSEVLTDYLNDIETNDFLLLKNEQHVSGNLIFQNVQASAITTDAINSIPFENLVTTLAEQKIRGLKEVMQMQSDVLNVQGQTNGEVLRDIIPSIAIIEDDGELRGHVTLDAISEIKGDVFLIGKINGYIELAQLLKEAVLKDSRQQLKGRMCFESPVALRDNLAVKGHINDLLTSQLMTLSTNQKIPGNLVFDSTLIVAKDLTTDSVSDLNLKTDAVLISSDPQFVLGQKSFLQDVTADFIDMTEYTTLDGVDPSLLVQDWVKHKEGLVKQNLTVLPKVVVLGNLTVIGGINGHDVFDLPETVWLKQTEQEIEIPISWKKITATHMFVTIVNTINVDSDIVHSYGDETIVSVKHFTNNVQATVFEATEDVYVNGLNTASFKTELEHYVNDGTIHGKKTIEHLEIVGDMDPTTFNDFDILKNVMRPQDYQVIYTPVQFQSELTVVKDNLNSASVKFDRFNSDDLKALLEDGVSKSVPIHPLKNKRITSLKAQGLKIPSENLLDSVPISDLLSKVVTLDTEQQIIGEKSFKSNFNSRKVSANILKGRPLSSFLSEIVYIDDTKPVSFKKFIGSFSVPSILIHKLINGIDILQLSTSNFDKTRNNDLIHPIAFLKGTEFSKLVTGFSIDGVDFGDLIYTNQEESLDALKLMSGTTMSNIFVTGLVNGCDLQQIQKHALYANKSAQIVEEEMTVEKIDVIGDIYIDDAVNQVPVQSLIQKFIMSTGDQIVTSDVVLKAGLQATGLKLADFNLPFMMGDAVRRTVPQSIGGYKKFKSLTSDVLDAKDLFLNGYLQGIKVDDLFENVVLKQGLQHISSEKIFKSFKTDVATVEGHFNGLMLPNDIVRVDTTEVINTPTYFMSNLILGSDLEVHGNLDDVNVASLLQNRITLSTSQNVDSNLKFISDVKVQGDLLIDGTVNDIVLDMVAKKSKNIPLDGYKVFVRDFYSEGSVAVPLINAHNVQSMDQSILKNNREEFVKDLQLFSKPLEARSHLFSDWINDISLTAITSTFFDAVNSLNGTLNYLQNLSYEFWQQLSGHMSVVHNKVSRFAYFILLQEINLGPTMKILKGYRLEQSTSEFSHSMVIWTSQKQCTYLEKCCHEEFSYWIRVKKSGHVMVDSQPEPGRLYPIPDPALTPTRKDFFVWTNARGQQPKWCDDERDEKMKLASLTDSKYLDVFIDIKNAPTLSDIKSFKKVHLYAVAGFHYNRIEGVYSNAVVYVFNEAKREWSEHQILPSSGVLSLDVTQDSGGTVLLAAGSGMGSYSSIYKWDDAQHEFKTLQYVSSTYVTSTLWFKRGQTQVLAMANVEEWPGKEGFCTKLVSGGEINIYTYDYSIQWIQSIPLSGVVSLVHFTLEEDIFLAAASTQLQSIFIYEWKGHHGFSVVQSMFVGEVTHLNTYKIEEDLYMTVATASGPAKILKVVTQGKSTVTPAYSEPNLTRDTLPEAQKDEAVKDTIPGCLT